MCHSVASRKFAAQIYSVFNKPIVILSEAKDLCSPALKANA
jgi:hypothetical protein